MLHTGMPEYRDGIAAVVPGIVDRVLNEIGDRQARLTAERAVDEVLADSFPASDPPSWNAGIIRPGPAHGFVTGAVPAQDRDKRLHVAEGFNVSRTTHGGRTFLQVLVALSGAVGIVLLLGVAILVLGLPIALIVRALLDAIGWLVGVAPY